MTITDVNIVLANSSSQEEDGKVLAYCSITIDHCFVVHNIRLIQGRDKVMVCMPYRKYADKCPACSIKCDITDAFCDFSDTFCRKCGTELPPTKDRIDAIYAKCGRRTKLFYDLCHPINHGTRAEIEAAITTAYESHIKLPDSPTNEC